MDNRGPATLFTPQQMMAGTGMSPQMGTMGMGMIGGGAGGSTMGLQSQASVASLSQMPGKKITILPSFFREIHYAINIERKFLP